MNYMPLAVDLPHPSGAHEANGGSQATTPDLSSREAAEFLGVTSPATIKNWLEGGFFPGSYKTQNGDWLFRRDELKATKSRIELLRQRNVQGHLDFVEVPEDAPPAPLL
jgi:hypothetical protein